MGIMTETLTDGSSVILNFDNSYNSRMQPGCGGIITQYTVT